MTRRRDLLRSGLQSLVTRATDFAAHNPSFQRVRTQVQDLIERRMQVPIEIIRKELLRVEGVDSLMVRIRDEQVSIEATFVHAAPLSIDFSIDRVFFAPRGGKEVFVRCSPPEMARHALAPDIAAAFVSAIMRVVWAPLAAQDTSRTTGAFVERDDEGMLRVDARTLTFLRPILRAPTTAMMIETLSLQAVHVRGDTVIAELTNPFVVR